MSWETELAKLFKSRDNKSPIGAIIGQVISASPLRVSIFHGKVILDSPYRCSILNVDIGDDVLCIADSAGQTYFVIDKVVK